VPPTLAPCLDGAYSSSTDASLNATSSVDASGLQMMLLSEGYTMYFGAAKDAPAYFDSLGYG